MEHDENKLIAERRDKLAAIRRQGVAFPNDFKPTHHAADLQSRHGDTPNEELEPQAIRVAVAALELVEQGLDAGEAHGTAVGHEHKQ